MPDQDAPILVTGLPRSGTSWVGKMLEASGQVVYINEPLNPQHPPGLSPGILDGPDPVPYQYISKHNGEQWEGPFGRMLELRYRPGAELRRNHSPYDIVRMLKYLYSFSVGRIRGRRPMMDDPYALMSVRWLAEELGMKVVVLVREPRSYVGSRIHLGWDASLERLASQGLLMRDLFAESGQRIIESLEDPDEVLKTAVLWSSCYDVVDRHYRGVPGVEIVTYESLAKAPIPGFGDLYDRLDLTMTDRIRNRIAAATSSPTDRRRAFRWTGASKTAFQPMDSGSNLEIYRDRLTPDQIGVVDRATAGTRSRFYPAWSPPHDRG
jgi:hypothetical protein